MAHTIDKQFSFCYGHRVWSQTLQAEFCDVGDANCKCRFMHGHQATVHVYLESEDLTGGMVTDFKHLGWLNTFLDQTLDHKFILDINDPWFNNIINLEPIWDGSELINFRSRLPLNTAEGPSLPARKVYVPGTDVVAGYKVGYTHLSGTEREFLEGFFITTFLPTSEHLSKWVFKIVEAKMSKLNVRVSRVDWYETPKSRSSYSV